MIKTLGRVLESPHGTTIATERPPVPNISDRVEVIWHDKRMISPDQRKKAYALMAEIADWSGNTADEVKAAMKVDFRKRTLETMHSELFSLADADMSTAREFISFLIDFMLENDVPSSRPLADMADDIERYIYACCINRKCAVCGRRGEIHHVDRIGMGGDRREMCHMGMRVLPLCRMHHQEAHERGDDWMMEAYHLVTVPVDEKIAKVNKLGRVQ